MVITLSFSDFLLIIAMINRKYEIQSYFAYCLMDDYIAMSVLKKIGLEDLL